MDPWSLIRYVNAEARKTILNVANFLKCKNVIAREYLTRITDLMKTIALRLKFKSNFPLDP